MGILEDMNIRYCESYGWKLKDGERFNCHQTFLPYFCMDASFQEFLNFKKNHKLVREAKQAAGRMSQAYKAYFAKFRAIFTEEQQDFLLDLTDLFEEYIPHHVLITKVAYMNAVSKFMDFGQQQDSASIWVVNMLSAAGQGWYSVINPKNSKGENRLDMNIASVLVGSRDISDKLFGTEHNFITEDSADKVDEAIQALINNVERWVRKLSADYFAEQDAEAGKDEKLQQLLDKYRKED